MNEVKPCKYQPLHFLSLYAMRRNEKKRKQTRSGIILNLRLFLYKKNWRPAFSPAGRWTFSFNLGVGEEFDKLLHEGRHWRGLRVSCRAADESRNVGQLVCRSRYPSSSSFFLVCALEAVDLIRHGPLEGAQRPHCSLSSHRHGRHRQDLLLPGSRSASGFGGRQPTAAIRSVGRERR